MNNDRLHERANRSCEFDVENVRLKLQEFLGQIIRLVKLIVEEQVQDLLCLLQADLLIVLMRNEPHQRDAFLAVRRVQGVRLLAALEFGLVMLVLLTKLL